MLGNYHITTILPLQSGRPPGIRGLGFGSVYSDSCLSWSIFRILWQFASRSRVSRVSWKPGFTALNPYIIPPKAMMIFFTRPPP